MRKCFLLLLMLLFTCGSQAQPPDTTAYCLPLRHLRINSSFGYRRNPVTRCFQHHNGIDLYAHFDTVFSVLPGVVCRIGNDPVTGNYVVIDHGAGLETLYGHLSAIAVSPGETLNAGDVVAISGASGRVTGPHLHFAVRLNGRAVDPLLFLRGLFRPP